MTTVYAVMDSDNELAAAYTDKTMAERFLDATYCDGYIVPCPLDDNLDQLRDKYHFRIELSLQRGELYLLKRCAPTPTKNPLVLGNHFEFECWAYEGYDALKQAEQARRNYLAQEKAALEANKQ